MKADCKVIVFAKAPLPGFAKTRLARVIGDQAAADLAARMLTHAVLQALAADLGPVELCCTPDASHPAFLAVAAEYPVALTLQGDGDLGARMQRALARALDTHRQVLLIGTDAPGLNPAHLREGARLLLSQPAVFAPAHDGGYVLVGLAQVLPGLFDGIAWSTDQVMQQTRARLRQLNVDCVELPTVHDIDEPDDLKHLPAEWLACPNNEI